jgi:hypothetical protein
LWYSEYSPIMILASDLRCLLMPINDRIKIMGFKPLWPSIANKSY